MSQRGIVEIVGTTLITLKYVQSLLQRLFEKGKQWHPPDLDDIDTMGSKQTRTMQLKALAVAAIDTVLILPDLKQRSSMHQAV